MQLPKLPNVFISSPFTRPRYLANIYVLAKWGSPTLVDMNTPVSTVEERGIVASALVCDPKIAC